MPRIPRATHPFTSAARLSDQTRPTSSTNPSHSRSRKRKQRGLNAFAIASAEGGEDARVRRGRLGENEELDFEEAGRKRRRVDGGDEDGDDDDDDDEDGDLRHTAEDGAEGGSDGEGREWRVGVGSDGGDEEVDSDEAFGSSDEERFEGFEFRGSKGVEKRSRPWKKDGGGGRGKVPSRDVDLDEEDEDEDEDEGSLGSEAVDLAQILDDEDEGQGRPSHSGGGQREKAITNSATDLSAFTSFDDKGAMDLQPHTVGDDLGNSDDPSASEAPSEEDDTQNNADDPDKLSRLQDLMSSIPDPSADQDPSDNEAPAQPSAARMLAALKSMPNLDPALARSAKRLTRAAETTSSKNPNGRAPAPLPKRQQDRIDRAAAYAQARGTLNRWIDTVKHNRRAEHLSFPLKDPSASQPHGLNRLLPTSTNKPANGLEDAIQSILQESGMAPTGQGANPEKQIIQAEDLATQSLPLEEVQARRAELRKARDLLFREEQRAKRIKKIKSKSYRRVHRREKESLAQQERNLLASAGLGEMEDEEREEHDRRRAEERMGARHKESRWAKSMKKSGRAAWDEEAKSGVTEMARRNEDLRRRMDGGEASAGEDEMLSASQDDEPREEATQLHRQISSIDTVDPAKEPTTTSRLASMKFMQRADARRRAENDAAAASLRRDLIGEDEPDPSDSEHNAPQSGRKTFGPAGTRNQTSRKPRKQRNEKKNELEEGSASSPSDSEDEQDKRPPTRTTQPPPLKSQSQSQPQPQPKPKGKSPTPRPPQHQAPPRANPIPEPTPPAKTSPSPSPTPTLNANPTLSSPNLIHLAFDTSAGANPTETFSAEKAALIDAETAEAEPPDANPALPGWGCWTGAGLDRARKPKPPPQKQKQEQRQRQEPAAPRRDPREKNPNVIVSAKRSAKNTRYLAPTLPHPFESREQYERSLRMPVGREWRTGESFREGTKPRVVVKRGEVVRPLSRPLL